MHVSADTFQRQDLMPALVQTTMNFKFNFINFAKYMLRKYQPITNGEADECEPKEIDAGEILKKKKFRTKFEK